MSAGQPVLEQPATGVFRVIAVSHFAVLAFIAVYLNFGGR